MEKKLYLPSPKNDDDRDSSLVVYTITAAISVSLFVLSLSISDSAVWSKGLNLLAAALLLISTLLALKAIEYVVDITSFAYSNSLNDRKRKYKKTLRYYNISVILIVIPLLLLLLNFFVKYIADVIVHIDKMPNDCFAWVHPALIILILVSAGTIGYFAVRKWRKDLSFIEDASVEERSL